MRKWIKLRAAGARKATENPSFRYLLFRTEGIYTHVGVDFFYREGTGSCAFQII
jgi:hypothetical protein